MQAIDRDLPPNNVFSYVLMSGAYSSNFSVDPSTGKISVVAPLDYENLPSGYNGHLNLTIEAVDNKNPSLNSSTSVTILVQVNVYDYHDKFDVT